MKKARQFWPLLKQMLGLYRFGPLRLLFWLFFLGFALFFGAVFSPESWEETSDFAAMQMLSAATLWSFLMVISTPLPFQLLGGELSLEFLFTRAVDRAIWLRTTRVAMMLLLVAPLLINLAVSSWEPPCRSPPLTPAHRLPPCRHAI